MFVDLKNIYYQNPFLVYVDKNSGTLFIIDTKKQMWTTIGIASFYTGINFKEVIWNYVDVYNTYKVQVKDGKFYVENIEEILHLVIIIVYLNSMNSIMNNPNSPMGKMVAQIMEGYYGIQASQMDHLRTCYKEMSQNNNNPN